MTKFSRVLFSAAVAANVAFSKPVSFQEALQALEVRSVPVRDAICFSIRFSDAVSFNATEPDAKKLLRKRNKIEKGMLAAIARVLAYVKHETLRNLDRFGREIGKQNNFSGFIAANSIKDENPDSVRITFNLDQFRDDLLAALETEQLDALNTASQATLDSIGYRDPWKLPAQSAIDFIARRQNLLRDVPDEIWQEITDAITQGMSEGDPIAKLAQRITDTFGAIEQGRATVIAQTETAAAYSFSGDKAMREAGIKYKQWFHSAVSVVPRPDHLAIDQLIVPIDQPYPVGNPPLMIPHDPEGSPGDVINCGCISLAATEEEFQAQQAAFRRAA